MTTKERKVRTGRVLSAKMNKTVVVGVVRYKVHPIYGKAVRLMKRYKAHDEKSECHEGDLVEIIETRPLSKEKRWRVGAILERGDQASTEILKVERGASQTTEDVAAEENKA